MCPVRCVTYVSGRTPDTRIPMVNYFDPEAIAARVARGEHREVIGGRWDEMGKLQFEFLRANGLKPSSLLLDIGCGSLRAGVHFAEYLESGHYFGTDINQSLLDAGYDIELTSRGLHNRIPRTNLVCDDSFEFPGLGHGFDFALAQSLFTHLTDNKIRRCLSTLAPIMSPRGTLFATFFLVPDDHPVGTLFHHRGGIASSDRRDPFHYRPGAIREWCESLPWHPSFVGEWNHPRGQQMVKFRVK